MQKDSTISLRIDSELKKDVEEILNSLGIPMTTAITMYFSQIKLNNGIPFTPVIPKRPKSYEEYTGQDFIEMMEKAEKEYHEGKTIPEAEVEKEMKELMKND